VVLSREGVRELLERQPNWQDSHIVRAGHVTGNMDDRGVIRRIGIGQWLIAAAIAILAAVLVVGVVQLWHYAHSFSDQEFIADYATSDWEVGTALRLPKLGVLSEKGRYFVIAVYRKDGQLLKTLYEGPGGYPDPPERPSFLFADGRSASYDIPEVGHRMFDIGDPTATGHLKTGGAPTEPPNAASDQ
jgi:hypothetical protein